MVAFFLILAGLVALVIGAELLVRGASRLAAAVGISSLVVGLTVVAFGTSAPEMAVSVASSLSGQGDIALGNVVGSNIFNVLFILGMSALIVPLVVDQKLVRFDVPLILLLSIVVWIFSWDLRISQWEGILLLVGIVAYTVHCVVVGRKEAAAVKQEYDEAFSPPPAEDSTSGKTNPWLALGWQLLLIAGGLVLLVLGAKWLVDGATSLARGLGISELVIGLTIVSVGTSLPELATSIVAAMRGERDIAVGNVVGSNIFNILAVLGLSAGVLPGGVSVAEQAWQFDIPVMIVVSAACLPVFFTGHLISRWEGGVFVGYYIAYTIALILLATQNEAFLQFEVLVIGFIAPLTLLTLGIAVSRSVDQWRWQKSRDRFAQDDASLPQVVIIGGGFGGLSVARNLARSDMRVTLIDRCNYHLFQPLLYQVATGSLSPANIATPLRNLLRKNWNVAVQMAEVREIDLHRKKVLLEEGPEVRFDYLIVAAGVRHSYFGHAQWESAAPGLKSIEDATEMRRRILTAFEAAEIEQDEARRRQLLTFVIVGGGPTGVELAGSLGEIARHTLEFEFRSINPKEARIMLIEAADRILTMYPPELSAKARTSLERLGIEVRCQTRVLEVEEGELTLAVHDGEEILPATTILWAAGIEASPLARNLAQQSGAGLDRVGRIAVQPDLSLVDHPHVFVIGDMADCRVADGQPLPGIAPVAMQQGKYVANVIRQAVKADSGKPRQPFRYRHQGSLATIGRSAAVAYIGGWKLSGFTAWLLWLLIHIANLSQFESRLLVFIQWVWSFVTFGRSARLITGQKAHASPVSDEEVIGKS
ncbi:calcium/sodium antiporter [Bremerella sp.]|uniref:calcium/sodium antiporter n=1 Tax=Bremerella sp. TaxID=2795602 RepID=UPI00391BC08E